MKIQFSTYCVWSGQVHVRVSFLAIPQDSIPEVLGRRLEGRGRCSGASCFTPRGAGHSQGWGGEVTEQSSPPLGLGQGQRDPVHAGCTHTDSSHTSGGGRASGLLSWAEPSLGTRRVGGDLAVMSPALPGREAGTGSARTGQMSTLDCGCRAHTSREVLPRGLPLPRAIRLAEVREGSGLGPSSLSHVPR